jgi:DNA (cytosine-5)-methyltransferase 1
MPRCTQSHCEPRKAMTNRATRKLPREIRFVDLCAGIGGFHHALHIAQAALERGEAGPESLETTCFRCVLASELDPQLRKLYVANFGDSLRADYARHYPLERTRQLVEGLRSRQSLLADDLDIYSANGELLRVHGDLTALLDDSREGLRRWPDSDEFLVPEHDLLCAGFPCQPFSKSGAQRGFMDDTRGTVFHTLAKILECRRPRLVFLENVGNFERHDGGNTWQHVQSILRALGYDVRATTQVGSSNSGLGLLSPHHVGFPHLRERFFIVAQHREQHSPFEESTHPFPKVPRGRSARAEGRPQIEAEAVRRLKDIIATSSPTPAEEEAATLHPDREECLEHWNQLLHRIDEHERECRTRATSSLLPMPSFPIWGYELDPWNHYPIETNPGEFLSVTDRAVRWRRNWLLRNMQEFGEACHFPPRTLAEFNDFRSSEATRCWLETVPSYAASRSEWPRWKQQYIKQNREWAKQLWLALEPEWFRGWLDTLMTMIPSHQKLEWNCQGGELDLRQHILQFRPSGLRAKRFGHVPALVAMTTTQIPVVPVRSESEDGPETLTNRHLLAVEALQLQGFPADWRIPPSRDDAFRALGNAVHAGLVAAIVQTWLFAGIHDSAPSGQLTLPTILLDGAPTHANVVLSDDLRPDRR